MKKDCIEYLEYMSRHGLDARVLQEYKQCGLLYASRRCNDDNADIHRFVDFDGTERRTIKLVDNLENDLGIDVFHVIENNEKAIVVMYHDSDLDFDYQFKQFKTGKCTAIRYNLENECWTYADLQYEVRLGAVVDVDFKFNM